jgi:hypothetical protein
MITLARKQTIKGPGGLKIELDADEIFPDDPGQGTPILVSLPEGGERYTATYNCAVSENEVDGIYLNDDQIDFLQNLDCELDNWLTHHWQASVK